MSKYLMIDSHHQLIVKCCYPWNVWEKCDPAWGDHFISSRYCVSCRFCRNSFCHFYQIPCAPEKNFLWIWARRVRESGWSSEIACCWRSWRNWRRCGEKADIEGEGIDVVFSAPALAISGFELHGFIFSEIVRRKGLEGQTLSECVVDTARPPQCEFSNLQNTINLLFRFSCRPVIEFF